MNDAQYRAKIKRMVDRDGLVQTARDLRVSHGNLSRFVNGHKKAWPQLLSATGYERVISYTVAKRNGMA